MSAHERYNRPRPKPLTHLSRAAVAARCFAVRSALDTLACQSELDGGPVYECTGAMKKCLIDLEAQLRELDRSAPAIPFAAAALEPAARERLAAAGGELHQILDAISWDAFTAAKRAK